MEIYQEKVIDFLSSYALPGNYIYFDIVSHLRGQDGPVSVYLSSTSVLREVHKLERKRLVFISSHFAYDQRCLVVVMMKGRTIYNIFFGTDPRTFSESNHIYIEDGELQWMCSDEDEAVRIVEDEKIKVSSLFCKSKEQKRWYFGFDKEATTFGPSELVLIYDGEEVPIDFPITPLRQMVVREDDFDTFISRDNGYVEVVVAGREGEEGDIGAIFTVYLDGRSKIPKVYDPWNLPSSYLLVRIMAIPNGNPLAIPINAKKTVYYEKHSNGLVAKSGYID